MFGIFDKLGGEQSVLEILQNARPRRAGGEPLPGIAALKKWKRERRIPPINAVILQGECDRRGIEWTPDDFLPASQDGAAA